MVGKRSARGHSSPAKRARVSPSVSPSGSSSLGLSSDGSQQLSATPTPVHPPTVWSVPVSSDNESHNSGGDGDDDDTSNPRPLPPAPPSDDSAADPPFEDAGETVDSDDNDEVVDGGQGEDDDVEAFVRQLSSGAPGTLFAGLGGNSPVRSSDRSSSNGRAILPAYSIIARLTAVSQPSSATHRREPTMDPQRILRSRSMGPGGSGPRATSSVKTCFGG